MSEMAMLRQLPADLAEPSGVKLPLVPTECHEHCVEVVLHFPRVALIERVDGATHTAANLSEALMSTENGYNLIPSPDGKYLAYVRTGWADPYGSGGFGRSKSRV
jgi:hypothetical protein